MGRKPKYNSEIKIDAVKRYLSGKKSMISLSKELSVERTMIKLSCFIIYSYHLSSTIQC